MHKITVKDLLDLKGKGSLTEVVLDTVKDAEACAASSIDMIAISEHSNVGAIRSAAPDCFLTVGLTHGEYFSKSEVKKAGFALLKQGADAIYCPVNQKWVEALSEEGIPAIGHVGMVPMISTWTGGAKPVAQSAKEAFQLFKSVRGMRAAGAFAVQMELVPSKVAEEISKRTNILVISRGSGDGCDGQSVYAGDLLGSGRSPSSPYFRSYRNHAKEYQRLYEDTVLAFGEFKKDVDLSKVTLPEHQIDLAKDEFETFMYALEKAIAKKG